ncbi:NADH-quinone oxidoreductase subunit L [Plantactinospora sp. WMMB334]|uniref:NADH-quinone oxidoreductase subunit 5 family protein n=1 Tax=Plantactinospora sp. WMMB334 TaxID=3404119 RepID=UPI003B95A2C7
MSWLAWSLIAVPLAAGATLAVAGRRADRIAAPAAVTVSIVTLGLVGAAAVRRPAASAPLFAGIEAAVRVDGLSAVMVLAVAAVTVAVLLFAAADPELSGGHRAEPAETHDRTGGRRSGARQQRRPRGDGHPADPRPEAGRGRFFGLMLLFAGAMLTTVTATTLPLLLMAWEVMGAASWALIGFWWRERPRVRAARTAFLTTRAADLGLYLAAGAAMAGGVLSLRLDALPAATGGWLSVLTAGVLLAALGKSAQLPFSFWLSRAMAGPGPVSALLHSATMVAAGAYLLLRLHPLLAASGWGAPTAAWIGAVTALLMGLVAVAQTDVKQLLAASTSAQVGFMVLAAGTGGLVGGVAHWVAHAATKSLLFLTAGVWLAVLGTGRLAELRGAARRLPLVGAAFAAGAATLAGLPPLALWATKDRILAAAFAEQPALYAVGLAAGLVATGYGVKLAWYLFRPDPAGGVPDGGGADRGVPAGAGADRGVPAGAGADRGVPAGGGADSGMLVPLGVLGVAAVGLGALALPGPWRALRETLGIAAAPSAPGWQVAASITVALVGAALAWWCMPAARLRSPGAARWPHRWLGLEAVAYRWLADRALLLGRALARFDDRVLDPAVSGLARTGPWLARTAARHAEARLDGAVRGVARAGLWVARTAGRTDDGLLDRLVRGLGAGGRRLGALARRPQTGLAHQHYAEFTVALAVLILFLLFVG